MAKQKIAVLDENGVLVGFKQVSVCCTDDLEVPEDCDLRPGKYRWDEVAGSFVPLRQKGVDPLSLTIRAMAEFMKAARDQNVVDLTGCADVEVFLAKWEQGGEI